MDSYAPNFIQNKAHYDHRYVQDRIVGKLMIFIIEVLGVYHEQAMKDAH